MGRAVRYIFLFVVVVAGLTAQGQERILPYRLHFSLSPSVSTGARFETGSTTAATPNITGTHYLYPLFSLLWGRPNPQYTSLQNFARKFNYSLLFELVVSRQHSLTTGFEIGARGYGIHSDQSDDFIVMYRNLNIPVFYTHTSRLGSYWRWRNHVGAAVNRASSVTKLTYDVIDIKRSPMYYPTVFVGTEISYLQARGPFSYGIEYHHGFKNVIDHRYLALDYAVGREGLKIFSNGSHFRINIKWFFAAGTFKLKQKSKPVEKVPDVVIEKDPTEDFKLRNKKLPVEVKVKNTHIELCFRDDQTVDGDSITIELNGVFIAKSVSLTRKEACYKIDLKPDVGNELVIHANNMGKIPPNTYEVIYYDGDHRETLKLKSDLDNSSTINFLVDPYMEH